MQKVSAKIKRTKIADYMAALPESFDIIEDNLLEESPSVKLKTNTRMLNLHVDDAGIVVEDFEMLPDAGAKEEFLKKQKAYNAIKKYYDDYYTNAKIKESSFDGGFIKIELETRIITLTYNDKYSGVEEKERARRGTKKKELDDSLAWNLMMQKMSEEEEQNEENPIESSAENDTLDQTAGQNEDTQIMSEDKEPDAAPKAKRHRRTKAEIQMEKLKKQGFKEVKDPVVKNLLKKVESHDYEQSTIYDFVDNEEESQTQSRKREYPKFAEGSFVKNIYNNKTYKVIKSIENIVYVFDKDTGYHTMARADVETVNIEES